MNWVKRYRIKLYIRNSIWIFPALSIAGALLAVALLNRIESALGWQMSLSPDTARAVMGTIASSLFTLVAIASSAILVVVQLASAQLTPRLIALVYRNSVRKFSISLFVFTFTFSVAVLVRIEDQVPLLTSYIAAYGFLLNLAFFLYFIDDMGKTLRPSAVVRTVALAGREVVQSVYPKHIGDEQLPLTDSIMNWNGQRHRIVLNEVDGVILAFDLKGLVSLAEKSNCVIELVPEIGDFVAAGTPLFRIYEGGNELDDDVLRRFIALGQERTLEQDPMFALRIIVDIAIKALSPAINDPTTAVLSIDQLHHLLRDIGNRHLSEGQEVDSRGRLRLVYRTPDWEDFVRLSVTEIRHYGRDSVQVIRRLRAMLENLMQTLPEHRAPSLQQELRLIGLSTKRVFADADDQMLAETGDMQGMGGESERTPTPQIS
jgi:uncharacterized membrane protein